ncbi:zn-dependent protease domain protein [Clostridioides difficile DA00044]|nr:zn-dependent protease domain protein [Clostridioides difficile]EQG12630.1 zn-dependent protease domain protein [Clostridioides difficile DA00044]
MLSMNIGEIVASLVGIAMAISIHEFGHAYQLTYWEMIQLKLMVE